MFLLILEREEEGERKRERERQTDRQTLMWEKHWSVASRKWFDLGLHPQPRCVPWLGIEPAAFLVYGMTVQPTEPPGQGHINID